MQHKYYVIHRAFSAMILRKSCTFFTTDNKNFLIYELIVMFTDTK